MLNNVVFLAFCFRGLLPSEKGPFLRVVRMMTFEADAGLAAAFPKDALLQ